MPQGICDQLNAALTQLGLPHLHIHHVSQLSPRLSLQILSALFPELSALIGSITPLKTPSNHATGSSKTWVSRDEQRALDEAKLFLGVLQTDVLTMLHSDPEEEYLHAVDPRGFAQGSRKECDSVCRVLVWVARRILSEDSNRPKHIGSSSRTQTRVWRGISRPANIFTKDEEVADSDLFSSSAVSSIPRQTRSRVDHTSPRTPSPPHLSAPSALEHGYSPVRRHVASPQHLIRPVDQDVEVRAFEAREERSRYRSFFPSVTSTPPSRRTRSFEPASRFGDESDASPSLNRITLLRTVRRAPSTPMKLLTICLT